jgi:hypothetical protein
MRETPMTRIKILAGALLVLVAGATSAADKAHRHHGFGPSVEHAAMHNIMADLISAKTGRPAADVRKLFADGDPREAVEKLGLSRDDMHALMKQAHEQLVARAAAAGLITAEQATKIRAMPLPEPGEHRGDHGGRDDDGDERGPPRE